MRKHEAAVLTLLVLVSGLAVSCRKQQPAATQPAVATGEESVKPRPRASSAPGVAKPPRATSTTSVADEGSMEALLARGDKLLRSLPHLDEGYTNTACMEVEFAGRPVGVAELSLAVRKERGRLIHDYRYSTMMGTMDGDAYRVEVDAMTDPVFSPLMIHSEDILEQAGASKRATSIEVTIGRGNLTIAREGEEGASAETLDLPPRPFIIAASFIFQLVDIPLDAPFAFRVFQPQTGTVVHQRFDPQKEADGSILLITRNEGKDATGHYRIGADGSLVSFRIPEAPASMTATTREKHDAYKNRILEARRRASSRPASEPTSQESSRPAL